MRHYQPGDEKRIFKEVLGGSVQKEMGTNDTKHVKIDFRALHLLLNAHYWEKENHFVLYIFFSST